MPDDQAVSYCQHSTASNEVVATDGRSTQRVIRLNYRTVCTVLLRNNAKWQIGRQRLKDVCTRSKFDGKYRDRYTLTPDGVLRNVFY